LQRHRGDGPAVRGPSLDDARERAVEALLRAIEAEGDDERAADERASKSAPTDASRRR
jgi:hypothetical protein